MAAVLPAPTPRDRALATARAELRQAEAKDADEITRVAAERIVAEMPDAPQTGRVWEAEVRRQQRWAATRLRDEMRAEVAGMVEADQRAREDRYCTNLAHDIGQVGMTSGELTASLLLGTSRQEREAYRLCAGQFRRARAFTR